jgi:branched-chain amino acid transport system ATP-binding protein
VSAILACTDICKRYGGLVVLDGVSLSADSGQILGLAGPNGAGKTTLLDVLTGRVRADSGRVTIGGLDVTRSSTFRRARLGLARSFQSPLVPESLTVGEVLEAARVGSLPHRHRDDIQQARELGRLDVPDGTQAIRLDALDRRKLLVTCLLVQRPRVLLLDEPASGLLQDEITELDRIIRGVTNELGLAVIVVEHRLELLFALAQRAVVLDEGRLIADGPTAEVFSDPVVRAAYFEAPALA